METTHIQTLTKYMPDLEYGTIFKKTHSECKGAELSAKSVGKDLQEVFKYVENELNNSFPTLVEP